MRRNDNFRNSAVSISALMTFAGLARASVLDTREMALSCESTLVDLDMAALGFHYGQQPGATLNYVSLVSTGGWQGRMWGSYAGRSVDIYYTGTIVPTGGSGDEHAINYSSDWHIDGVSGGGSGGATYVQLPETRQPSFNFKIDWLNMTVSGDVSVSYGAATLSLSGTKDFPNHKMSITGSASVLSLPILGAAAEASLSVELDQLTGEYHSTLSAQVLFGLISEEEEVNHGYIRKPPPPPPNPPPPVPPPRYPTPPPVYPYPSDYTSGNGGFPGDGSPAYTNNQVTDTTPSPGGIALAAVGMILAFPRRR